MLEMLSLEAGAFYIQVSYTNKLGGFKSPHSWASFKVIIFNFYQQLLVNDQRNQSSRKILELCSMNSKTSAARAQIKAGLIIT